MAPRDRDMADLFFCFNVMLGLFLLILLVSVYVVRLSDPDGNVHPL